MAAAAWTRAGVVEWVRTKLGEDSEEVTKVLEKEGVNGSALLKLSEGHLEKMGLKVGPRMNLLEAIAALKGTPIRARTCTRTCSHMYPMNSQ